MNEFGVRFPNVVIVAAHHELRTCLKNMIAQFGSVSVTDASSISAITSTAFDNLSLAIVDLDSLNGVDENCIKLKIRPYWVVGICDSASVPPMWRLYQWGMDDFLIKPVSPYQLQQRLLDLPADQAEVVKQLARSWVGWRGVKDIQVEIRNAMYKEALVQTSGNKCRAARLLGVSRGAVQKELRGY
jgi:DNA-binding NtrC family response regulator